MRTAAIIGGGVSGATLALRLLAREDGPAILLFEPGRVGPGLAYATENPSHRLNVRAGRMSLYPERPDDFTTWLADTAPAFADPESFPPRGLFGRYVQARLAHAEAAAPPGRLRRVPARVTDLEPSAGRWLLRTDDGGGWRADAAVLATGVAPPTKAPGLTDLGSRLVADPWRDGALAGVPRDGAVLLLGTGLTTADVLLSLEDAGWRGRAIALSRRGLSPRPHPVRHVEGVPIDLATGPLSRRVSAFRRSAAAVGWLPLMESLRPQGQALWRELSDAQRRRFLRHLRPWWDVHRHRMAGEVAGRLEGLRAAGRLRNVAGRLVAARSHGTGLIATLRRRGLAQTEKIAADRLILCNGPDPDPFAAGGPVFDALAGRGLARADAFGLGLSADEEGRVKTAEGAPPLYAMGALLKGTLWETVAVPELREQARRIAALL